MADLEHPCVSGIDASMRVRLGDRAVRIRCRQSHHDQPVRSICTATASSPSLHRWRAGFRKARKLPEVTTDVPVGAMRAFDFIADNPSDWSLSIAQGASHHNAMGHDMRNSIGVPSRTRKAFRNARADVMAMGSTAWRWATWRCRARHTLHDDVGQRPVRPAVEMGGMFTVVKSAKASRRGRLPRSGRTMHPPGTDA